MFVDKISDSDFYLRFMLYSVPWAIYGCIWGRIGSCKDTAYWDKLYMGEDRLVHILGKAVYGGE